MACCDWQNYDLEMTSEIKVLLSTLTATFCDSGGEEGITDGFWGPPINISDTCDFCNVKFVLYTTKTGCLRQHKVPKQNFAK